MSEKGNLILPLELMDKTIGNRVWILLKGNKEFVGIFRGLDDYWNMVLDDVKEMYYLYINTLLYLSKTTGCQS